MTTGDNRKKYQKYKVGTYIGILSNQRPHIIKNRDIFIFFRKTTNLIKQTKRFKISKQVLYKFNLHKLERKFTTGRINAINSLHFDTKLRAPCFREEARGV